MNISKKYLNTKCKIVKSEGILGENLGWRSFYSGFMIYYLIFFISNLIVRGYLPDNMQIFNMRHPM